ncbi:F-box protein CPR1-like [Macadamia integrifolia]|uniref:F-box protein CPR1-like n=1 Tax=Macadamia integrifolia TaxID=60698 RepID=UPI001C4FA0BB|nr:F-box protein CPR1-like [Macadamia integrifolia]
MILQQENSRLDHEEKKREEFRRVCKSWYKLIHDPVFIQSHLQHSIPGLIVNRTLIDRRCIYETYFKDMKNKESTKEDLKFGTKGEIIGSCNGLVFLKTKRTHFSVANLMTKKGVNLPSTTRSGLDFLQLYYGFTYVPEIGIYKLVHLLMYKNTLKCEVLSLGGSGSNAWRCINGSTISLTGEDEKWQFHSSKVVAINGFVHFVGLRLVQSSSVYIVSFDAGAEVLNLIRSPIHYFSMCDPFLELGGVLSLVEATDHSENNTYNVWILKDWLKGTWVKQHTFSVRKPSVEGTLQWVNRSDSAQVLCSLSHGGRKTIIFQIKSSSERVSHIEYDLELNQESEIKFDISSGCPSGFFTYVNSLISPKLL